MRRPRRLYTIDDMDDYEAIRQLVARYNHSFDGRDTDGWLAVWTEDGELVYPDGSSTKGHAALREMVNGPGAGSGRHVTSDFIIEVDGDTARQKAYFNYLDRSNGHRSFTFGIYDDELVRQDGRWLFKRRRVTTDKPIS
jgi:uncharacterized protein (TIGR02246 family)